MTEISTAWASEVAEDTARAEAMQHDREAAEFARQREARNWERAESLIERIGVEKEDVGPVDMPPFEFVKISLPVPLGDLEVTDSEGRSRLFAKVFTTRDSRSEKVERKGRFLRYQTTVYNPAGPRRSGVMYFAGLPDGSALRRFAHTVEHSMDGEAAIKAEDAFDALESKLETNEGTQPQEG